MTLPEKAARDLMEEGQALVHSLARKIHRTTPDSVELDDLIAYGQLGLAEAAREFDPSYETRFTTFAYYRIRGAIYDGLSKMSWSSRARYNRIRLEQMAQEALQRENDGKADEPATAEEAAKWFRRVTDKLAVVYLATHGEEGGGIRDSSIEDPQAAPSKIVAYQDLGELLRGMIARLPTTEQELIRATYFDGATLQDAAKKLGISKSWASRTHARILEQLARSLRRMGVTGSTM